jgi:hypothetical protein
VQAHASFPEQVNAAKLLQAAVGIDDAGRAAIVARLARLGHAESAAAVVLGVVLGALAIQDGGLGGGTTLPRGFSEW